MQRFKLAREGIFFPGEISEMIAELKEGEHYGETSAEREDRAHAIILRHTIALPSKPTVP